MDRYCQPSSSPTPFARKNLRGLVGDDLGVMLRFLFGTRTFQVNLAAWQILVS